MIAVRSNPILDSAESRKKLKNDLLEKYRHQQEHHLITMGSLHSQIKSTSSEAHQKLIKAIFIECVSIFEESLERVLPDFRSGKKADMN